MLTQGKLGCEKSGNSNKQVYWNKKLGMFIA